MEVAGSFKGLSSDRVKGLKPGDKLTSGGSAAVVLSVGTPVPSAITLATGKDTRRVPIKDQMDLPATLRVGCYVINAGEGALKCVVSGPTQQSDIAPGSVMPLAAPDGAWASFQIDEVKK
jgi:hypothetical protein